MAARTPTDFLTPTRLYVLQQAAQGFTSVALSQAVRAIDTPAVRGVLNSRMVKRAYRHIYLASWSQQKKPSTMGHRGWIHRCLSLLAKDGLVYERQRPEQVNINRERCDKYFAIRITQADAKAALEELGVPVHQVRRVSEHFTPSLREP